MLKKIFGHSFLYTIANNVPLLANFIILPIITPFLTSEDYGIYGLLFAYLGAFSIFKNLGFEVSFQNSYFKNKGNFVEIWSKYFTFLLLWRVIYSGLLTILLYFLFKNKVGENIEIFLIIIIVPILFFELTKTIGIRYCQYEGNHKFVYITSFIASLFTTITSFITIYYFKMGYMGWLYASLVASFIQFLFFTYIINYKLKIVPKFYNSISYIKKAFKVGLPIIPHNYSNYLLESSDRVVLDFYKTPINIIGSYNIAYSIANYFGSFNSSMNSILSPIYFRCFAMSDSKKSEVLVNSVTILWFSFILFFTILISLWSKEVFKFLYRNPDLYVAYEYLPYIIIGMIYRPFYVVSVVKSIFLEQTKSILKISIGGGLINLLSNLIFVPFFGIKAVLVSTFISYLYLGFSGFYFSDLKENIDFKYNPLWFLFIIIMTLLFSVSILNLNLYLKSVITILICIGGIMLYLFKGKDVIRNLNNENLL